MIKTLVTGLLDEKKVDPTDPIDTSENDPDIIDVEKEDDKPVYIPRQIDTVTPLTLLFRKGTDKGNIATLVLLCKDNDRDVLFTISHNYIAKNEDEINSLYDIPFFEENNFISTKIAADMIMREEESYISDLRYNYEKDNEINQKFYIDAVMNKKDNKDRYRFYMSPTIFTSIAFLDDFICNPYENNHDIILATTGGFIKEDTPADVFLVDRVDKIISLADTDKGNNIAAVIKFMRFTASSSDSIKVLCSFDTETKINKKKFNCTIKDLEAEFTKDADQYITDFMLFAHVHNVDKDFDIIKISNKNKESTIVMMDMDIRKELEDMISNE